MESQGQCWSQELGQQCLSSEMGRSEDWALCPTFLEVIVD